MLLYAVRDSKTLQTGSDSSVIQLVQPGFEGARSSSGMNEEHMQSSRYAARAQRPAGASQCASEAPNAACCLLPAAGRRLLAD